MGIKCFWLEPVDQVRHQLRRYSLDRSCPGPYKYHDAMSPEIAMFTIPVPVKGTCEPAAPSVDRSDPRWPVKCDYCAYQFTEHDNWQPWTERMFRRSDNGELVTLRDAPVGSMWDAWWYSDHMRGLDGIALVVKLPCGSEWVVDGPCSNCDQPNRPHKCWVRIGTIPNITVGKGGPGESCNVGAGSVQTGGWHGFLRNGELVKCGE